MRISSKYSFYGNAINFDCDPSDAAKQFQVWHLNLKYDFYISYSIPLSMHASLNCISAKLEVSQLQENLYITFAYKIEGRKKRIL